MIRNSSSTIVGILFVLLAQAQAQALEGSSPPKLLAAKSETSIGGELATQWHQFKKKYLEAQTEKWTGELESAGKITKEALENARYGTDRIVKILKRSKSFPVSLQNQRIVIVNPDVQITVKQAYITHLVNDVMAEPISLDADVTNSYFQLSRSVISFDQKHNIIVANYYDGFAGFKGVVKAGIKVHRATIQFAPQLIQKGDRMTLLLQARMTYIDISDHSPVIDKLFASIVEELVLSKGPLIRRDMSQQLRIDRPVVVFGEKKYLRISPNRIGVNVDNSHLIISAKM